MRYYGVVVYLAVEGDVDDVVVDDAIPNPIYGSYAAVGVGAVVGCWDCDVDVAQGSRWFGLLHHCVLLFRQAVQLLWQLGNGSSSQIVSML
jgi:hypothetical protein